MTKISRSGIPADFFVSVSSGASALRYFDKFSDHKLSEQVKT